MGRRLMPIRDGLGEIRVPRGALALLCALLLTPVGFAAFGHSPNISGGYWTHHHTTSYTTCNDIDVASLNDAADDARYSWRDATNGANPPQTTGLLFPNHQACSANDPDPDAHLELTDYNWGTTGWRAQAVHQGGSPVSGHDATTSRLQFNLGEIGANMTNYHKQALACRTIGETIGLAPIPSSGWAAEGLSNDCMSFQGPAQQSKKDYPNNYTFAAQPGAHSLDLIRQRYAAHGPHLDSVGGTLVSAADAEDYLTESSYSLTVAASNGTASVAPAPGTWSVKILVDGQQKDYVEQGCSSAPCALNRSFTFVSDDYSDGSHSVEVVVRDARGSEVRGTFSVIVDRRGSVYHASEYTDNPASGGQLLTEQWVSLDSGDSRTDEDEVITTRSNVACDSMHAENSRCAEMHQLAELGPNEEGFVVYTGSSESDQSIKGEAPILDPVLPGAAPISQGPLASILEPWQTAPPAHGAQYQRYESTRTEVVSPDPDDEAAPDQTVELVDKVWVDSATGLPLRRETADPSGVIDRAIYTYGPRLEHAALGSDFFAVEPTTSLVLDKQVDRVGANPVGSQVDEETGASFQPQYLGSNPTIAGAHYCLATSQLVRMNEVVGLSPPGDLAEDPENALDPDAQASTTSVSAGYNRLGSGESCEPGEEAAEEGSLLVVSEYKPSPDPTAWRQIYHSEAEAIEDDPAADPGSGGVLDVEVNGIESPAFAIPLDGGDQPPPPPSSGDAEDLSVLIAGTTQITISGDFEMPEIQEIADELEPQ